MSDATGNLASHMIHAVITQFPSVDFELHYHLFLDEPGKLMKELKKLRGQKHLVFHALLDPEMKRMVHTLCEDKDIPDFDLTGKMVQFVADHTRTAPANELARLHHAGEGYFRKIRAMEFTAQHDDNRRIDTIEKADVVIVGLSRVSKSPTSTWLGAKGYKVANVAITRETGFPKELERVVDRTVAFTCRPRDLYEIRTRRFERFREKIEGESLDHLEYYDLRSVVSEVAWSEKKYRALGYPILDVTGHTVEEIAVMVLTELEIENDDMMYRH